MSTRSARAGLVTILACGVLIGPAVEAFAAQIPLPGSNLFIETSGPNAGIGIGDYYTAPGGGNTDHVFLVYVPSDWPAGTAVTVALYDPELSVPDPVSPPAVDEIRGAADTSTFSLLTPSGSTLASRTYSGSATNGSWVTLATFDPGVTGTGSYELHVTVSDDDDNSWRLDTTHDPDCPIGGPGSCDGHLVSGNEADAAGGSPIGLGVIRTSYQHGASGNACQNHVFYVSPATPRPLRAHNFDMDGAGSATYTAPNGSVYPGTVSGNGVWNGSSTAIRAGDLLVDMNGWWTATICISSGNQYVFEAPNASPSVFQNQPTPRLQLVKTDGVDVVRIGDSITYQLTVTNVSDTDPLPGTAYGVVVSDAIPAGLEYENCAVSSPLTCSESGGVVTVSSSQPLAPGAAWAYAINYTVAADPGLSIQNVATASFEDHLGNVFPTVESIDTDDVEFAPLLQAIASGPASVLRGDTAGIAFDVSHDPATDGSPVGSVGFSCALCDTIAYVSGDDGDGLLEAGEIWRYEGSVVTTAGHSDPTNVSGTVTGTDNDDDEVIASAAHSIALVEPASVSGVVFEDLNGNGTLDSGEPGIDGAIVMLTGPQSGLSGTTDGDFQFTDLEPGSYDLELDGTDLPAGLFPTGGNPLSVTLSEGEAAADLDFGFSRPVTISGYVFSDADRDGTLSGAEHGIGGVTLELQNGGGSTLATTVSDSAGYFSFETMPGSYRIVASAGFPTGWMLTTPGSKSTGPVLSGDTLDGADFGLANRPPVLDGSGQTIDIQHGLDRLHASDPEGSQVGYSLYSGDLPTGVTLLEDGTFDGVAGSYGTFEIVIEVCDDADPRSCATYDYTIVVRPATLVHDVGSSSDSDSDGPGTSQSGQDPEVTSPSALPFTGIETSDMVIAGLVLLGVGFLVVRLGNELGPDDFDLDPADS